MQPTERELNQKVEVYIGKTSFWRMAANPAND